jgi:predicted acylesterase/phospholipase RssA
MPKTLVISLALAFAAAGAAAVAMQQSQIRQKLAASPPGIYIKPDLDDVRLLHFDRVDEVISQARPAADELRRRLRDAIAGEAPAK